MSSNVISSTKKVSLPGKVVDLLWSDDEFYREVVSSKKINLDKFPKTDQWVDENGFNVEFALAGYSRDDIRIKVLDNAVYVESNRLKTEVPGSIDEDGNRSAKPKITYGVIVRGIARRSFRSKIVISPDFKAEEMVARMSNGLLHIEIPENNSVNFKNIEITER
jgi:HSP20 family molecular chaperone IbpA